MAVDIARPRMPVDTALRRNGELAVAGKARAYNDSQAFCRACGSTANVTLRAVSARMADNGAPAQRRRAGGSAAKRSRAWMHASLSSAQDVLSTDPAGPTRPSEAKA